MFLSLGRSGEGKRGVGAEQQQGRARLLDELRTAVARIERHGTTAAARAVLPFGHPDLHGSISSRASQYRSCSRTRCTAAASRGFEDAQRGHGAAEEEHSAAEGGDVLVAAGTGAEEVAQLIVPSTEPRR
jgi:hypothetical protein